jgi:hypothetical protein
MEYENNIDWLKIFEAYKFYEKKYYKNVNTDWTVERIYTDVTKPIEINAVSLDNMDLIGSAEQIFIKMMANGSISHGSFMALTPCFRNEPIVDALHRKYFMKLELLIAGEFLSEDFDKMIHQSLDFFSQYLPVDKIMTGHDQYDIVDSQKGIELGSYGIRQWNNMSWIYGTGIAEPRLSTVMKILNNENNMPL